MFKTTSTIVDSFSFYNSYIFTPSFNNLDGGGGSKRTILEHIFCTCLSITKNLIDWVCSVENMVKNFKSIFEQSKTWVSGQYKKVMKKQKVNSQILCKIQSSVVLCILGEKNRFFFCFFLSLCENYEPTLEKEKNT